MGSAIIVFIGRVFGNEEARGKMAGTARSGVPTLAQEAVLVKSEQMPEGSMTVRGYNFDDSRARGQVDYHALLQSYRTSGFQAMNFGLAVEQISQMVHRDFNSRIKEPHDNCKI